MPRHGEVKHLNYMYLNILLKRKKEPTHHFSFSSKPEIKTDKEHSYRGFNKKYDSSKFNRSLD